jgi:hypothetical protein
MQLLSISFAKKYVANFKSYVNLIFMSFSFKNIYENFVSYDLESIESFKISLIIFNEIYNNIQKDLEVNNLFIYKSISNLGYSRNFILSTFYFIEDYLNSNNLLENENQKLQFELILCKKLFLKTYLDVDKKYIPMDNIVDHINFGRNFTINQKHELQKIKDLKLYTWRNSKYSMNFKKRISNKLYIILKFI